MKTLSKIATSAVTALMLGMGALTLPTAAQAGFSISIGVAPPPPLVEVVPAPRSGYVWAPGHYEWREYRHVWMPGGWLMARPGYVYRAPQWRPEHGHWVYYPPRWDRDGHRRYFGLYRN